MTNRRQRIVHKPKPRQLRRGVEAKELKRLHERTSDLSELMLEKINSFAQLPLSKKTLEALDAASYVKLTDIQKMALPRALCGKDVLGAAKTGSGKTLAFLIPMLEKLYRSSWSPEDGVGALVISPTRELALQIFQVLRKIGNKHTFSAGLVIGGKDVKMEKERINRMNILICTPGRLLQHMDETAGFECDNLQMLVLDEADRILDLGFSKTMNAIVQNLPKQRQTLLFSATQTKSVKDLARLSLRDPEYVAVHKMAEAATPTQLKQTYAVCNLPEKLDLLWSFIRMHLQHKTIVFISSCKQVRFIFETFRRMQPGVTLLHLHGKQKQQARMVVYDSFTKAKTAVLFATDIAARGLDFPAVHWVLQLDCPEDADTYIHRVGRTARYLQDGSALMLLCPSEEVGMLDLLEKRKVPISKISINPSKTVHVTSQLQALCSEFPDIKYLAQKAFVSYTRSIHLQNNKDIFDLNALPLDNFAEALGLAGSPKIKFVKKSDVKNVPRAPTNAEIEVEIEPKLCSSDSESDDNDNHDGNNSDNVTETKSVKTKMDRMFGRKNQDVLSEHYNKLIDRSEDAKHRTNIIRMLFSDNDSDDEDDTLLFVKRPNHELEDEVDNIKFVPTEPMSHRRILREREKALKLAPNRSKMYFDEEGNATSLYDVQDEAEYHKLYDVDQERKIYQSEKAREMKAVDSKDKIVQQEKLRAKRLEKKIKEKQRQNNIETQPNDSVVTLGNDNEYNENEDETNHDDSFESVSSISEEEDLVSDCESISCRESKPTIQKRKRKNSDPNSHSLPKERCVDYIMNEVKAEDQEALAMRLLGM